MDTQYWMTVHCHLGSSLDCTAILITQVLRMTKKFSIGPDGTNFRYTYRSVLNMHVNGTTVYRCHHAPHVRPDTVFWLARKKDGRWGVFEAHKDCKQPVREGKWIFKTKFPINDITSPGALDWMWYDTRKEIWIEFNVKFMTRLLEVP